jgi:hypothetical protein
MKESLEKAIYPAFAAKWKQEHGDDVHFTSSFAGSETVTYQILQGVKAQVAILSTPAPSKDTQIWTDVQLAVPLNESIDFVLLGTLRLGSDVSRPVDERIGVAFLFKTGKYLSWQPSYLHVDMQPSKNQFSNEERLSLAGTFTIPLGRFTLSDRNLLERRFRRPQGESTRYRNRLQIEHPIKVRQTKITLLVSDEVFYDSVVKAWVRNRFLAGVRKSFSKHFTLDVYYLRQNDGHSKPGDLNVVGDTLRFRL